MQTRRMKVQGKLEQLLGRMMRAFGRRTGNQKLRVQGAAEQVRGKAREGVGRTAEGAKRRIESRSRPSVPFVH